MKEYEILEVRGFIVHANSEEEALKKFGNYDYETEGECWEEVRELGKVEIL